MSLCTRVSTSKAPGAAWLLQVGIIYPYSNIDDQVKLKTEWLECVSVLFGHRVDDEPLECSITTIG